MENPYENVVGVVRQILEDYEIPESNDPEIDELLGLIRAGKCQTCRAPLTDHTIVFVSQHGVVAAYCSGPCVQDMAVMGWLQEQHQDLQSSILFRGGAGDRPINGSE